MFWIHGGAFTGGTGADPALEGGNMGSRGDVAIVATNYHLSTLRIRRYYHSPRLDPPILVASVATQTILQYSDSLLVQRLFVPF